MHPEQQDFSVDIVLPALNEAATIEATIRSLYNAIPAARLILVDNGSVDDTAELAAAEFQRLKCKSLILHVPEKGKGNAVRAGFTRAHADVVVMIDADNTYPADRIQDLIRPVIEGEAEMVVGDRHSSGSYRAENDRQFHGFGNRLIQYLVNLSFGSRLNDILSGYRAFSRTFVATYPIMVSGFELEADLTIHALDKRLRVLEIPVSITSRPEGSLSKLHTTRDGARVIRTLLNLFRMYRPLEFFGGLGAVALIVSLLAGALPIADFILFEYVYHVPLAVLAVGAFVAFLLLLSLGLVLDAVADQARRQFELRLIAESRYASRHRAVGPAGLPSA